MPRRRELDEVSAALADVQARQQSLSRGAVLPRTSSPPAATAAPSTSPSPPAVKEKARQPPPFEWLKRRVVRRSERKESALDDLGSLELVPSASLAAVRALIGQFISLPPRREFLFVHPTTGASMAPAGESDVLAAGFPFICIQLLPMKESGAVGGASVASAATLVAKEQQRRQRPTTAHQKLLPFQTKLRPRTVENSAKRQSVDVLEVQASSAADMQVDRAPRPADKDNSVQEHEPLDRKSVGEEEKKERAVSRSRVGSVSSKRTSGELRLALESTASLLAKPEVKLTQEQTAVRKRTEHFGSTHRDKSASIYAAKETGDAASTEPAEVLARVGEEEPERGNTPRTSLTRESSLNATRTVTNPDNQDVVHDDAAQQSHKSELARAYLTSEASSLNNSRKPGPLRRSRHFKARTLSKLAENNWSIEEEQEVISDVQVEKLIQLAVEVFFTRLPGVDSRQLDAACQFYGIDYHDLGLQGILLALDAELSAKCNHVRGGIDGQLTQYLLRLLPADLEDAQDPDVVRHFENALNLFAGMRGWQAPTKLRASVFEERQRLQLIPASDIRRLALLRLSDRDRQLFAVASSGNTLTGFDKWLADGLEITYILLYGFLQSRRNSGSKSLATLDAIYARQARILAAVQKLSSFSFDVWKRLEFRTTDIDDISMMRRLNELMRCFVQDSKSYSEEVQGSVFFPAIVGYLARKSEQLTQRLSGLMAPIHRGSLQNIAMEYLGLLRQQLQQQELHVPAAEAYLVSCGLRIIDIDKINASRSSAGLGRIYVSGKESILTHYQCQMMARDASLHLKARWEQQDLAGGKISRHFFAGPKDTALEYVFVRTNPETTSGDNIRWEDREAVAKKVAQQAFSLLCGDSLEIPLDVAIGVGINIIHTDLLPHISSLLSLSTVLREYSATSSLSLGYYYEPVTQATRVIFRLHADTCKGPRHEDDDEIADGSGMKNVIKEVDRFLRYANDEEAVAFCEAEGLRFLHSCLKEQGYLWRTIKYGMPFSEFIYGMDGADRLSQRARENLLQTIKRTIVIFPRALQSITRPNLQIIVQLIETLPVLCDVGDEAISVIRTICSNVHQPVLTGLESKYSVSPMTQTQRKFSDEGGLGILVSATKHLERLPARKHSVETAIATLLMTHELSALKGGLLVHWREWLSFYVEKRAWKISTDTQAFSVCLLHQLHQHFFTSSCFVEPLAEKCLCGCKGEIVDILDACVGVMEIFVRLMVTKVGVTWAQEEMQGPQDCVSFLSWSVQQNSNVSSMAVLQPRIIQSLCEFLERLTSSHQYLQILATLTPRLLSLLHQQNCPSLHPGTLRVLSLMFRLAVDKKVWSISMETFLTAYYQIIESICDVPSLSNMNAVTTHVLFTSEYLEHDGDFSTSILHLLHEEHVNFVGGSGQLSPVARSRTKSFLQSLVSFCSLTWNSVLQPFCQIPAIISLGWVLTNLDVAEDLAQLELDELLLSLMESDNVVVCVLATRAYITFLFQAVVSRRSMDEYRLKRLSNLLATALGSGARLMLSPKRRSDSDNPDIIQFAMNQFDLYSILLRYSALNNETRGKILQHELEQNDSPEVEQSVISVIWEGSEWSDSSRASAEKLSSNLKLLTVFSAMTTNVVSIGSSDEIRQIILLLVRFVRERVHTVSHHVTLYLLPLRNIVWATRSDLARWGILELTEATFLRKLLLLSVDRVHQELASAILWGLADAYEKTNTFLLAFEVDDALAKSSYATKKTGFAVMVEKLSSKIASGRCVENECGALASMIANSTSCEIFITDYGYPFVLKLIDSTLRSTMVTAIAAKDGEVSMKNPSGELFGTMLFYSHPIRTTKDRELFQLCRAATKVLEVMQRASPESIVDEAARTKATMLPLLNHPNKQIALHAVWCCSTHLQGHPTKCGKLFEPEVQDKVIEFFFDETFPPIQAAAFSCMKLALADQKSLASLQDKISPLRERIVSCLRSPHFQVKRKVIVFLVEAIFRFDNETFLDDIARAFATPDNHGVLLELFGSLSKELELNPVAGGVLQAVVRLILKLDLVAHTDGDKLVHCICLTLKAHSTDTFLRPTLFNCLHQIVIQDDRVTYLERKSRLDAITGLLSQQLTLNELRNVANMLFTVASKHDGICHYLRGFTSGCIPKIVGVINGFSEYAKENDTNEPLHIQDALMSNPKGITNKTQREGASQEPSAMVLLKATTAKAVYISHFTEDIYEQFLNLLLLLLTGCKFSSEERYGCLCEEGGCSNCDPCDIIAKARCGHHILRIATARRVSCTTYDLANLLSAPAEIAENILCLSIQVLEILALNRQSRVQMLRGAAKLEWSWMPYMVRNAALPTDQVRAADESDGFRMCEASAVHAILLLGHLSAAKEVAQRLVADGQTIALLFSYLSPADASLTIDVEIRRASSFTLARLAEHASVVRDTSFQEKMAMLSHPAAIDYDELQSSQGECDTIVLVNKMVLGRNRALLTPGLQGRSADDSTLALLIRLLNPPKANDDEWSEAEVGIIAADVLSHLLYFRVNARDEKRLRSVLWRYARAMSPTKPIEDQSRPSSKRLTAYLHNWIGPILQKLRKSAFGASRGDLLQLLRDEMTYTCQQLGEDASVGELLQVLIALHLQPPVDEFIAEIKSAEVETSNEYDPKDPDIVMPYKCKREQRSRKRYRVAFSEADRSTREANDNSFRGSPHLWLFLRRLWELAIDEVKNGNERSRLAISAVKEMARANISRVLTQWNRERGTSFSVLTFDRRQCFLEFVIGVGQEDPGLLSAFDVRTTVEIVVEYGPDSAAILGREYQLLCHACQHSQLNAEAVVQCFYLEGDQDVPSESFRRFWRRVQLKQLPMKMVCPSAASTKMTIQDPSPDADLPTIFGVELLKILSSRVPQTVRWYAQCQGNTQLLDMMLQASRASALQLQHLLVRTFLSNLLYLVSQLVHLDFETYHRIFALDPRYLRCVVDLIYAPAHEVQSSAIKLVQSLALHPPLFSMLSRLENVAQPLGAFSSDAVVYVGEVLNSHQVSPPFTHDRMIVLAHIWLVPIFTDLSVTELVKLSLGFSLCTQRAENSWMLLTDDFRFSAIPEWMLEANDSTHVSFTDAMKCINQRFEGALHQRKQKLSMYAIDKEGYMNTTTGATRRRVALRLGNLLNTYEDNTKIYRNFARTRNGLVTRLGRLLVEDRAEIIRRVAYTKRVSERVLFDQMQDQQLSDLLSLLQENPLFEGVSRDHLANLAFRLGAPIDITIAGTVSKQRLPLILVYDEAVNFELHVPNGLEVLRGNVSRGGLLGFPPWLENKSGNEDSFTVVYKCGLLGTIISMEVLESELPEPTLSLVEQRLRNSYEVGNIEAIAQLMGLHDAVPKLISGRRRLQSSASALLVQLITADVFINSLLNDGWAIRVIVDVALAALSPDIVLNALTVTAAMTASEGLAKHFCTKAMKSDRPHGKMPETITNPLQLVVVLVNRLKLRLWQTHPEILEKFFLVQSQVARFLPSFWPNLEKIWNAKYVCSCLDLLRLGPALVTDVVGSHLSSAIPHRIDFLLDCGRTMNLHLELATLLSQTRGGRMVGVLQLFSVFCMDEALHEEIWQHVVTSSHAFDGALSLVATAMSQFLDAHTTDDLEVYCNFMYLTCTSNFDELLDSEFKSAIESRFGILSTLLAKLPQLSVGHLSCIVLRCIGGICMASESNSTIAVTTRIYDEDKQEEVLLVDIVILTLAELEHQVTIRQAIDTLLVEATFSCIDALTPVTDHMERFNPASLVTVALHVIEAFTVTSQVLTTLTVPAVQAVVRSISNALTAKQDRYVQVFICDGKLSILLAGYECISRNLSAAPDKFQLFRLLTEYTGLLNCLLSSRSFCDMLWTASFQDIESSNPFVTWMYHWIVFKATECPQISALIPSRSQKQLRLLAVTDKLRSATLTLATRLSEHEAFSEILSAHADFGKVVAHIFAALKDSSDDTIELTTAWVRLVCFVAEQWDNAGTSKKRHTDQQRLKSVKKFLSYVNIQVLLKACDNGNDSHDAFVCYVMRFLWLLVKMLSVLTRTATSGMEWHGLMPLATKILLSSAFSKRTKCYVVGLLAELSEDETFLLSLVQESSRFLDVVESALVLLNSDQLGLPRETAALASSDIANDFLSSRKSSATEDQDKELRFGFTHQTQRLILHLWKIPETRLALSNATFFHPLACRTIFVGAIALLSATGKSDAWTMAQLDALKLVAVLLNSHTDERTEPGSTRSALRSYRLTARREGYLQHCIRLLLEMQTRQFQLTVAESLICYMNQNTCASLDVADLREQKKGDLIQVLLSAIDADATAEEPESSDVTLRYLQLYNLIIEFSFSNAAYAARADNMKIFSQLRERAVGRDTLVSSDLSRTFFCVVRMLGSSQPGVGLCLVDEIWEVVCAILLHPRVTSYPIALNHALEMLGCSASCTTELCEIVWREWEGRGRLVILCLANLVTYTRLLGKDGTWISDSDIAVTELSVKAMIQICSSEKICAYICNDSELVTVHVRECGDPRKKRQTQLLKFLLTKEDKNDCISALSEQLLTQLDEIVKLKREDRLRIIELLPHLAHFLERDDGIWNDILQCILVEIRRHSSEFESPEDRVTVARALYSVLNACDLSSIPREMILEFHVVLKRLIGASTAIIQCALPLFQDGNSQLHSAVVSKSAVSELMLLYSLTKFSVFVGADQSLVEQVGPSCCSLWMCMSSSRGSNLNDEEVALLLSRLVSHCLRVSGQTDSLQTFLHFRPYWRALIRMFISFRGGELYRSILKLLLQLLQGPSSHDVQQYSNDWLRVDLIDTLWWQVLTVTRSNEGETYQLRALWCSVLHTLCCSRAKALSIMDKRFLEEFILLEHRQTSDDSMQLPGNTSLLRLLSAVFRATSASDHDLFLQKEPATMECLADHCIRAITAIRGTGEVKWNAKQVLYALVVHERTLAAIQSACGLNPTENVTIDLEKRQVRLCALSELLLLCEDDVAELGQVLTLVLRICGSNDEIATLIRVRGVSDCWPMVDVLVEVLQQCIDSMSGTDPTRQIQLRPILLSTSEPAEFLPYHIQTEAHANATALALQLVYLCVDNQAFAESLKAEMDLLQQLFVCLAASSREVSSAAAAALSTLIRRTGDWDSDEGITATISRYVCDYGVYRKLDFFSTLDVQNLFAVSPPSLFPPCFVLLARWIRFYSVNLSLLGGSHIVVPFDASDEDSNHFTGLPHIANDDLHETLVVSVLDLLLYCVSNFHSEVYKSGNGEEEEREHWLLLQSLLTLCQRRSSVAESSQDAIIYRGSDTCLVVNGNIRSRSLELVQLICSLELPRTSSVQVFANTRQMTILMMIVERSTSSIEQCAAAQLMEALALHNSIKVLLIGDSSLLAQLGAWLENDMLQLLAAAIIQRLATSPLSRKYTSSNVFGFSPSVQQQLAHFLIVGYQQNTNKSLRSPPTGHGCLMSSTRSMRVSIEVEDGSKHSPRSMTWPVLTQLNFELLGPRGQCLRTFQYDGTLQHESDPLQYAIELEQTAYTIHLTMLVFGATESRHEFELPIRDTSISVSHSETVTLRFTQKMTSRYSSRWGVLPRMLGGDNLSPELFLGLSGILVEFCKNFKLFCDPVIDLPSQILVVLATSVSLSPVGRMEVACLEGLATWLPSQPTIDFFKKSIGPLLRLIQGLRQLSCVSEYIGQDKHIINAKEAPREITGVSDSDSPPLTFLEKFIQLIAAVEVADLTPTCLNVVFMENADVLLYLCSQFTPDQDPNATFLSLVAIAIRSNVAHCQTFLTPNTQLLLRSIFDAGVKQGEGQSESQQYSLLNFASLLTVRLARCPTASQDTVTGAARLELFSRVSFEVFARHEWVECFPYEAAQNLILACGFLSDGLAKCVAVDADTPEVERYSTLFGNSSIATDRLTVVESLLLFLGRPTSLEGDPAGSIDGQVASDSFARLAACIVASLIEKLPGRKQLEQKLLELLDVRATTSQHREFVLGNQFLAGLRKCLGITRYDFQSELNTLRLTYYSSIRAGVRTGIIPPQCSGVFQRFDQEHLLPTEKPQWHLDDVGDNGRRHSHLWRSSDDHPSLSSSKHLPVEDSKLESELRELLLFTNEHAELLSALTVNRKKAMTTAIRVATRNARVLVAFHAMTSVALDFYIDTAKRLQNQKKSGKRFSKTSEYLAQRRRRESVIVNLGDAERASFVEWLLLLEELAGLLCSGLHELDASYYAEIARQFRSLIVDLPMFLRKMERMGTHSRQQALMLFLDNLHRLLKRATNRNELRVVAANGSGVVDQTKRVRERLKRLDPQVSASLGVLLESPDGMENLPRALVAMAYMWRRTMGATTLEKAMATSKESVSLLKKITEKLMGVFGALRRPKRALRAVFLVILQFGVKQHKVKLQQFDIPSARQSSRPDTNSGNTDQSQSRSERGAVSFTRHYDKLPSPYPFCSLELALDHFGWESLSVKRTKLLLQLSTRKAAVTELLSLAFGIGEEEVERLSVLELAEHFQKLESVKKLTEVLEQLGQFAREDEISFTHLPSVTHGKLDMSLWRLMVRPIQRLRLFHLYQQTQRFVLGDLARRQSILDGYRQASPQKPPPPSEVRNEFGEKLVPTTGASYNRIVAGQTKQEESTPSTLAYATLSSAAKVLIPQSTLSVCDSILSRDPLSDDAAMRLLRKRNADQNGRSQMSSWWPSRRSAHYRRDRQVGLMDQTLRVIISLAARFVLVIAFWRQEELRADLQDPVMARAFDDLRARDDYYRLYHAKKGLGELVRVWMPSSGRLGLLLWQERRYALGGTLLSVVIALWLPILAFPGAEDDDQTPAVASERNIFMTRIVYSYGITIFVLSVVSIALIARNRFVLLEQTRLRLRPISRYYQNFLAVTAIVVELIQLNSLAFDPAVEWDDTDELPAAVQWLGQQGITRFGVSSVSELQALGILLLLLSWFVLLKCANKFQDTSVLLHRVLTKDLPALVNGFFYMGTISAFFSFLACIDCSKPHYSTSSKCTSSAQSSPFLIAHPSITCWTAEHQWYAMLGLWGITFFLPIGLLAHGMSQVLFQRETLDIKYAPVLLLVTQLVKAVAATAQAFFPLEPLVLASLGFIGNGVLFGLTLVMHSCSLWYIKYVKCSIYAASCWASLGAIHRLHYAEQSSMRSLNIIYFGWLTIVLATAAVILLRVWRRARAKQRDAELHFAAQQRLLNAGKSTRGLGAVEHKFMKAASKNSRDALTRAAFVSNATRLKASTPPPALNDFVARAKEFNEDDMPQSSVVFMQNARVLAKKLEEHDGLRRRR